MKYNRFFAFGCSFTSWHWITWADIIGKQFEDRYFNFGICASGNEFIFHRLTEAVARFNINQKDLVIICWTNFAREDRWINGWKTSGNIFTQDFYDKKFIEKYFNIKGSLIKTASFISGASHILNNLGCEYLFSSAFPMTQVDQYSDLFTNHEHDDVFSVYQKYFDLIQPSMTEYLYGNNIWENPDPIMIKYFEKDKKPWADHHPNVLQHLKYVNDILLPKLKNKLEMSKETLDWIDYWNQSTRKSDFFICEEGGQNFTQRWNRFHSNLL